MLGSLELEGFELVIVPLEVGEEVGTSVRAADPERQGHRDKSSNSLSNRGGEWG